MTVTRAAFLSLSLLTFAAPLAAQEFGLRVGRQFADQDLDGVVVSMSRSGLGPVGLDVTASRFNLSGAPRGTLWGTGLEAHVLRSGPARPYLLAGVDVGFGSGEGPNLWASWSAGAGWELLRVGILGVAAEARYRKVSDGLGAGVEAGVRIGLGARGARRGGLPTPIGSAAPPETPLSSILPAPGSLPAGSREARMAAVVQTAVDVMGTPYRWGGSAEDGFDCSGLIQYAFGRHGVTLPRRSIEQAGSGTEIRRELAALQPGDILTFATRGGSTVSHVGLYVGDGRFIHSSGTGVQVSRLAENDPYGAWWFRRWVGVRRVV